jgi:hypothetical protein
LTADLLKEAVQAVVVFKAQKALDRIEKEAGIL